MIYLPCPLRANTIACPQFPAVVTEQCSFTYQQLDNLLEMLISRLQAFNLVSQEPVALLCPSKFKSLLVILALWRMGITVCPLDHHLPSENIFKAMRQIKSRRLIGLKNGPQWEEIGLIDIDLVTADLEAVISAKTLPPTTTMNQYPFDQPASIIFTSGSSGQPKAVLHTIAQHYYSAKGANEFFSFQAQDRWLLALPLYHVSGLGIIWRALLGRGCVAIAELPTNIASIMEEFHPTHVSVVPTQLHRMVQTAASPQAYCFLKVVLVGGEHVPLTLCQHAVAQHLPVYISYGLTEAASTVAVSQKLEGEKISGPIEAHILNYREVKIAHDGEVLFRGQTLFQGYIDADGKYLPVDGDGWFPTGDTGYLTTRNTLVITGRKDNMFISGGENIQPEEIEQYLCQIEGVTRAIVVPMPDEEYGQRPVALIKLSDDRRIDLTTLRGHLQRNLPKYKIPDFFYHWTQECDSVEGLKVNRIQLVDLMMDSRVQFKPF